ncbi:MAG: hypothetical protein LCH59_06605 [Proteobacteria bacterium]|nr:hypothetical protein [Pseudomonadota bacterium]
MATNDSANLRVRISADLADIKQGLGVLRGELAKVKADAAKAAPDANAWTSGLGKIRNALGNLAGAYIGVQTITTGFNALFGAIDRMDRIDELSQITGDSAEELSKMAYAAKFGAVDIELFGKAVAKIGKDVFDSKSKIRQLGIEVDDSLTGRPKKATEIFKELADVFASLPSDIDKNRLAAELFGDRIGPGLIPLLNLGRKGIEDLGVEAEKTGNVFSGEAAAAAGQFNDMLGKLKFQAVGLANETAKNLLPSMTAYAEAGVAAGEASNFAATGGKALAVVLKGLAAIAIIAKNIVEALTNVIGFLGTIATEVAGTLLGGLVRAAGVFNKAFSSLASGQSPLSVFKQLVVDAGIAVKQNVASIGQMGTSISAGFDAMKDGVAEAYQDVKNIGKLFDDTAAAADKAAGDAKGAAESAAPANQKLLDLILKILGEDGDKSPNAKKIEQLADSTALLQDAVKRAQEALDRQLEDKQISIADYYAKRVQLQQQLIDLQVEQTKAELAITTELGKRRQLEEQLIILSRDRADAAVAGARDQKKAEAELNKERQDGYRDRLSNLTGGLSATEGSLSAQIDAGAIGMTEGERRLREERQKTLEQLRTLRAEQAAYLAQLAPESPEYSAARQSLLEIEAAIAGVTASMQEFRQDATDAGANALQSAFQNIKDGAMSAGDVVRQLFADFSDGLFNMASESLSKRAASAIAGLFDKGTEAIADTSVATAGATAAATIQTTAATTSATILTTAGTLLAQTMVTAATTSAQILAFASAFGAAHGGGIAGSLQMTRHGISPLVFGAAPRYHGGGVAGLMSNEVPAILQRGEVIRTRQQETALAAQLDAARNGGNAAAPIRNIIVFSEDELANAMSGAAGEKVIVNHARRNRGALNG